MKKKSLILIGIFFIIFIINACGVLGEITEISGNTETNPIIKYRVAVVDFENKTKYGQARLGSSASDILTTELVKSGGFIVVERAQLQKILDEQKFQQSGFVPQDSAISLGKILGLNALITGSVSQFGVKIEGEDALFVQTKRQTAEAVVDIRVIDVQTGRILYANSGKGTAKKESGAFLGMGSHAGYDETLEGKALREAILQFISDIVLQVSKEPWFCRIAEVEEKNIYLDAGMESGLQLGTRLEIYHIGKEIRSQSGDLIGSLEEKTGEAKVTKYFGSNGSIAELENGNLPLRGDMCRIAVQ